jgi:hypothetical protein
VRRPNVDGGDVTLSVPPDQPFVTPPPKPLAILSDAIRDEQDARGLGGGEKGIHA